jgi:hypothetical protein
MTMAADGPIFDVRATLTNGARLKLGLYATQADAAEWARWLVQTGDVTRVDVVLRVAGHIQLVAVIGPTRRFRWRRAVDRGERLSRAGADGAG